MLELTLNASNSGGKADIKIPVSKLLFRIKTVGSMGSKLSYDGDLPTQLPEYIEALSKLGTIEVLKYSEKAGSKTLINSMSIGTLAQIAANNEGYINSYFIPGVNNTTKVIEFSVELSNLGAIRADSNNFLQVIVKNFIPTEFHLHADDVTTMEIFSFGAPVTTDVFLSYKPVACNANGENRVDVGDAYAIAFPSSLISMDLFYQGGETQKLKGEEINMISSDLNEIVMKTVSGGIVTKLDYTVFPLHFAEKIHITLSASENCYLLINEQD